MRDKDPHDILFVAFIFSQYSKQHLNSANFFWNCFPFSFAKRIAAGKRQRLMGELQKTHLFNAKMEKLFSYSNQIFSLFLFPLSDFYFQTRKLEKLIFKKN